MNIIKISAVLTAALLTGALSATAFAAETLTTTTGSITFRKAIDVTNAAGAGGITGTIAFDVTAADESDLPDDGEKNYVGSVDQLDGSDITATFAADDSGIANKESDVSVGFDTSKFEAPGIYYYHLTERDPGIHGLAATTATYLLKVRVVNDNTSEPDGATFKIDYATLTSLDDNTKSDLITNTYTTHGLTVTKALAGDWADYTDNFIFTLEITDPDADPGRMASVTVQTTRRDEQRRGEALYKRQGQLLGDDPGRRCDQGDRPAHRRGLHDHRERPGRWEVYDGLDAGRRDAEHRKDPAHADGGCRRHGPDRHEYPQLDCPHRPAAGRRPLRRDAGAGRGQRAGVLPQAPP